VTTILAQPAPADDLILEPDIMARLDFAELFGNRQPVEMELGAGDGSFLAQYAALQPGSNFLGVERLLGRLRKLDKKGRRAGLTNLRCLRLEAAYVLEWMIPAGALAAVHVYFPDPWPKRRHWKRRLINSDFVRLAHRALAPGGVVFLRTDHESYFEQMNEVFGENPGFVAATDSAELLAVKTDFERGFNLQGIATRHVAFRRVA
jgi:tRNA (guanine-N7-)-methyltransferase